MPNYPNPPGVRIAYDKDGTVAVWGNPSGGTPTVQTSAQLLKLNNEDDDVDANKSSITPYFQALIFPRLMDISHWYAAISTTTDNGSWVFQTSADTTNGQDGTWTTRATVADSVVRHSVLPLARSGIQTLTGGTAVKAVRLAFLLTNNTGNGGTRALHIYGKPTTLTDQLAFWHPTIDAPLSDYPAHLDFEDKARGVTTDKFFRIKNVSATLTASGISVGMDSLTDGSPTLVSQHTFNYNGGSYGATASLSSLAPGAISQQFGVRQILLSTAPLGVWAQRVNATATGWT